MTRRLLLAVALLSAVADPAAADPAVADPAATSAWPCGNWGMYGATPARTFSTNCPSRIAPSTAPALLPLWIVKTPKTVTASPAVVDRTVYVGDWSGTFFALDAETGAERWRFVVDEAPGAAFGPIVSSAAVADVVVAGTLRRLVIFGGGPRLYALDAADGKAVWVADFSRGVENADNQTEIESSPVVHAGVVYVGVDTHGADEAQTGGMKGGLLAVDASTGTLLWQFEPELGQPGRGCGSVWSSPVIDGANGRLILGTANCAEPPERFTWNDHTEAITAIDLDTRAVAWTFRPHVPNRLDTDFGATPNLFIDAKGVATLGAGNKDAVYYAVDPGTGALRWKTAVAPPGNVRQDFAIGGFIGSPSTWAGNVFGGTAIGGPPYFHSLDGASGAVRWRGSNGPTYAASAAVNNVVITGALDSVVRAYDGATGAVLWSAPLLGPVSSGPAIVGDDVFIGSGTSSSDACAKELPGSSYCEVLFDEALGATGGVHAFRVAGGSGAPGTPPARRDPSPGAASGGGRGTALPATGARGSVVGALALAGLGVVALRAIRLQGSLKPTLRSPR